MGWLAFTLLISLALLLGFGFGVVVFVKLRDRFHNAISTLHERAEMEYLLIADTKPKEKHRRETYMEGWQGAVREMDRLCEKIFY